jgi:hypothetical protein
VGSGYLDFTTGQVLTADTVDGYLMRQTVMTFASSTARDTALSGVLDEGMVAYLEDTDSLTYCTGAAWRVIYSPRTAHTPTGSGAVTVGDGVFNVDYTRQGDIVTWGGQLTLGSTSAIGAGVITFSLPVAANTSNPKFGAAYFYDTSTDDNYAAVCQVAAGVFTVANIGSSGAAVSSTAPFTWASGDSILWSISYIAA